MRTSTKPTAVFFPVMLLFAVAESAFGTILNVPQKYQEQTNWCWSACSQSVLEYYGIVQTQTAIAAYGTPGQPNSTNFFWGTDSTSYGVDWILWRFGMPVATRVTGALSKADLTTEISSGKPPIIHWQWNSGGGHIVVARGIDADTLHLMDPFYGPTINNYAWVLNGRGGSGQWDLSLKIPKSPTYTIAGIVRTSGGAGINGVTLIGLPGPASTTADGSYTATVSYGWSGTVTPTKAGYSFTPATRTYASVAANSSGQNFSGNSAPTDIALSGTAIPENKPIGTVVGTLMAFDADAGDTFSYSLVSGSGSAENASFTLDGSSLKTAVSFNYEARSSYGIRVRATDQGGLWAEKAFTVMVSDVQEQAFKIIRITDNGGGGHGLQWTCEAGYAYQVRYSDTLAAGDWHDIGPIYTANNGELSSSFTDSTAAGIPRRFYVVVRTSLY